MLACCYLITAVCLVHGERILRRYYGIYKIRANQCRESARRHREQSHLEKPVKWLGAADLSSFEMVAVGHPMAVQQALLQEAILTAEAFGDKGPPCRGGPWSNPKVGQKGRDEITDVRRLARNAACPSDARQQVLEYCRKKNGYLMPASTDVLSRGGGVGGAGGWVGGEAVRCVPVVGGVHVGCAVLCSSHSASCVAADAAVAGARHSCPRVALLPVHGFGCQGVEVARRGAAAALVACACPCFAYLPACLPAVAVRCAARQPRAAAPPRARAMLASATPARAVFVVMSAAPLGFDSVRVCVAAHVAPLPGGTPASAVPCVTRCGHAATDVAFLISID